MPLLLFRQPLFAIARVLWRPVLAPWVGLAVTSAPVYNILWSFAAYTINSVGFFRGIRILLNIRRYLLGYITINNLTNIIIGISPILGFMFTNILRNPLIGIARLGLRKSFTTLISFIILNSFFLLARTVIYIGLRFISLILISMFSIFWFDKLSSFKKLLSLAFEVKDWFEDHLLPNGISLPIPKKRIRPEPFYKFILDTLYNITGSYPEKMNITSIFRNKQEIVTRRIGNIEELFKDNKLNEVISEPVNDVLVNNYISIIEFSSNIIFDFLFRILLHSFVEFNLFL